MTLDNAITMYKIWASDDRVEPSLREEHKQMVEWLKDYKRLLKKNFSYKDYATTYEESTCGKCIYNPQNHSMFYTADCIDRKAAIESYKDWCNNGFYDGVVEEDFDTILNELPSAQRKVKIGHWIDGRCSECLKDGLLEPVGESMYHRTYRIAHSRYCPNCGIKMENI